uniref:Protein kinase domain-containing protein n=1 Tax=Panagrellus redivivus TaxID=6233 RepID=A0A7E4V2J5_PANRE
MTPLLRCRLMFFFRRKFDMKILFYYVLNTLVALVSCQCPTFGMYGYVLVSITSSSSIDTFENLLDWYGKISHACGQTITHEIRFGLSKKRTITTQNLTVANFGPDIADLYGAAIIDDADSHLVANVVSDFFVEIDDQNTAPDTVVLKKVVTILTDHFSPNSTSSIAGMQLASDNADAFIMTPYRSVIDSIEHFDNEINTCIMDVASFEACANIFCKNLTLSIKNSVLPTPPPQVMSYIENFDGDIGMFRELAKQMVTGDLCVDNQRTIVKNHHIVHFMNNDEDVVFSLPWLGNMTEPFYGNCITPELMNKLNIRLGNNTALINIHRDDTCQEESAFYQNLLSDLSNQTLLNSSIVAYTTRNTNCLSNTLFKITKLGPELQLFFKADGKSRRSSLFDTFTAPIHDHFVEAKSKPVTVTFVASSEEVKNAMVVCQSVVAMANLTLAEKYKYREPWSIAIDQFFIVILLCGVSAVSIGSYFYRVSKKAYTDTSLDETDDYTVTKPMTQEEKMRNDILAWEVHIDRVQINHDFPLAQTPNSVIYLGKLKGKAPVMQWINMAEMRQFQDCTVAMRIPVRYDQEEEQQLLREINSMKIIKYHDYVANLLGWVNKNNFACTIMELTHTSLLKYVSQLKEGMIFTDLESSYCMIPYRQYLRIMGQICDAMAFIAQKGYCHRDLNAHNVLLTTGLRAKVSGFNFCSDVDDSCFFTDKPAFKLLNPRWMAIEAFKGSFSERSDVWSFGMLLYEVYTLGDKPLSNVRDNQILATLRDGHRPPKPTYASDEIYAIMNRCWKRFPERRPAFVEVKNQFDEILERQYDNQAFEFENNS